MLPPVKTYQVYCPHCPDHIGENRVDSMLDEETVSVRYGICVTQVYGNRHPKYDNPRGQERSDVSVPIRCGPRGTVYKGQRTEHRLKQRFNTTKSLRVANFDLRVDGMPPEIRHHKPMDGERYENSTSNPGGDDTNPPEDITWSRHSVSFLSASLTEQRRHRNRRHACLLLWSGRNASANQIRISPKYQQLPSVPQQAFGQDTSHNTLSPPRAGHWKLSLHHSPSHISSIFLGES